MKNCGVNYINFMKNLPYHRLGEESYTAHLSSRLGSESQIFINCTYLASIWGTNKLTDIVISKASMATSRIRVIL